MPIKTRIRRVSALLAALVCVGGIAAARASTVEERVAGLYANPEAIASLRKGIIPEGWEDRIELTYDEWNYRAKEGALEWFIFSSYSRLYLINPLGEQSPFRLELASFRHYHYPKENFFCFSGNGWLWAIFIPPEDYIEALTEFVTLATFCEQSADELTETELTEREQGIEAYLMGWKDQYPLELETLLADDIHQCMEGRYAEGTYTLDTWGEHERLRYALPEEQYKAAFSACVALEPGDRPAFVTAYAATLDQPPERVLELSDEGNNYCLSAVLYDDQFVLARSVDGRYISMYQEQYDIFAAEWLPLTPAERTAPMREAHEYHVPAHGK